MVDENGKQTITNDGATVMKVRRPPNDTAQYLPLESISEPILTIVSRSSSTLSTPPHESSSTLPGHKTPKSVTALRLLLSWLVRS